MTRRHGRSRRGIRLVAKMPHGRWRTLTFLAALRCDHITAPWLSTGRATAPASGPMSNSFWYRRSAGDIVLMDNLGSHKGAAVRQLIREAWAKLFFLPRYSPDLNPDRAGLRQT